MGLFISKCIGPQSPVEENHRVIGITGNSSNVDGISVHKNEVKKLLDMCKNARNKSHTLLKRKFVDVINHTGNKIDDVDQSFRLMQWNILADALCRGRDNFVKCPDMAKSWNFRKMQILEEILSYLPDIICLQEVDHFDDFFKVQLSKVGYNGAFLPKPWSPCLDVPNNSGADGCVMFYNSEKFDLLDYKGVTLKTLTFWTNHVALFHLLSFKKTGAKFLVGTTHLKARLGYESLRVSQGKDILRYLEPHSKAGIPIILCGDFNATPNELVYKLIREYDEQAFCSAYTLLKDSGRTSDSITEDEPSYTTWCIRPSGENPKTVDYVFLSRNHFSVDSLLELPTGDAIGLNRLPSLNYPSDHLSLVCDMTLLSTDSQSIRKNALLLPEPKI